MKGPHLQNVNVFFDETVKKSRGMTESCPGGIYCGSGQTPLLQQQHLSALHEFVGAKLIDENAA